ncbi:MAG: SpaA isopeptide-forming pilin-related protein [Eubacteriales bacterium]|nr:SpaA isopeptide-forming pilin-related protein [Eubacteriales bacterium]
MNSTNFYKKMLTVLLCISMVFTSVPIQTFAESGGGADVVQAEVPEKTEKTEEASAPPEAPVQTEAPAPPETPAQTEAPVQTEIPAQTEETVRAGTEYEEQQDSSEQETESESGTEEEFVTLRFDVLWEDGQNVFNVRPEPGFHLYANGVKLSEDAWTLKSVSRNSGKYTYEIKDLPAMDGELSIDYRIEEEAITGYNCTVLNFENDIRQDVDEKKLSFDREKQNRAEAQFENRLDVYTLTGKIIWGTDTESLRPENLKDIFVVRLSDGTEYENYLAEYETAEEVWNYTVTLPAIAFRDAEQVSSYIVSVKEENGLTVDGVLADGICVDADREASDTLLDIERREETDTESESRTETESETETGSETESETESAAETESNAAVMRSLRAYRSVGGVQVEESLGSAALEKTWYDNNSVSRPNLLNDGKGGSYLHVYFKIGDGEIQKLSSGNAADIGLDSMDEVKIVLADSGVGEDTYRVEGLPSKIRLESGGETSAVTYEIREDVSVSGYTQKEKNGKLINILNTSFKADIIYKVGGEDMSSFTPAGLKLEAAVAEGGVLKPMGTPVTLPEGSWNQEGNTFHLSVGDLPAYTDDGEEIVYRLVAENPNMPGSNTEDGCKTEYDNSTSANFGSRSDACYNGGTVILTRTGTTTYTARKEWQDDGSTDAIAARPGGILSLWRYTQKNNNSYLTASPVRYNNESVTAELITDPEQDGGQSVNEYMIRFTDNEGKAYSLEKYDPEGYLYVYLMREAMTDNGYTQIIYGPDGTVQKDDNSVYNDGKIVNRRTGTVSAAVTKNWIAGAEQGVLTHVDVQLELQRRLKGSTDESEWIKVKDKEMKSFSSVILTDTVQESVPRYAGDEIDGKEGWEYEYRWIENGIKFRGDTDVEFGTPSIDADGNITNTFEMNGEQYESIQTTVTDKDGNVSTIITNRLVGTVNYHIVKRWTDNGENVEGPKSAEVSIKLYADVNQSDREQCIGKENLTLTYKGSESSDTVTVYGKEDVKIQNNGRQDDKTWTLDITGLPKFNENGYRYHYEAYEAEVQNADGWHLERIDYGEDEDGYTATINNVKGPEPSHWIKVQKKWNDDGDVKYRGAVEVEVYYLDENGAEKVVGEPILLNETNNWWAWATVPEEDLENKDKMKIRETAIVRTSGSNPGRYEPGGTVTNSDGTTLETLNENQIATEKYVYDITYGYQPDRQNPDVEIMTVTNTRVGYLDYTIKKTWLDAGGETERPSSKLILYCDSTEYLDKDTMKQQEGNYQGWYTAEYIGYDSIKIPMTQTVNHEASVASGVELSYTYEKLPKYDSTGSVIHYRAVEIWDDPQDAEEKHYNIKYSYDLPYEDVRHDRDDQQVLEVTNVRRATKEVTFHKVWIDTDNFLNGKRPDIYLRLYRTDSANTDPVFVAEYREHRWETDEDFPLTDAQKNNIYARDYLWECTFYDLDMYDQNGHEITYYADERMSVTASDFDYQPVEYYDSYDELLAQEAGGTLTSDGAKAVREDGYFINRQAKTLTIEARKIWQNIPNGFPAEEFPEITYRLTRSKTVTKVDDKGNYLPGEKVEEISPVATHTFGADDRVGDTNEFVHTFGGAGETALDKYDELGRKYEYTLTETAPEGGSYDLIYKMNQVTNSFIVTNVYNGVNTGSILVSKLWSAPGVSAEDIKYPKAAYRLYRRYKLTASKAAGEGDERYSDWEYLNEVTIHADSLTTAGDLVNGTASFTNLLLYAPNGTLYQYKVEELPVDGYDAEVSVDSGYQAGTESPEMVFTVDEDGKLVPGSAPQAAFENTYKSPKILLRGQKNWDDYENAFHTRPSADELVQNLELYRSADAQSGETNAIAAQEVTFQTDDPKGANYFQWTDSDGNALGDDQWTAMDTSESWYYTIKNLDRYAPNAMPWKYSVKENALEAGEASNPDYPYGNGEKNANTANVDEDGNVTLEPLANTLETTAKVTKKWENLNKDIARHIQVVVKLQIRKESDTTWSDIETFADANQITLPENFETTHTLGPGPMGDNKWTYTFEKLPAGCYENGTWIPFRYRIVETKITDTVNGTNYEKTIAVSDSVNTDRTDSYTNDDSSYCTVTGKTENGTSTITNTMSGTLSLTIKKKWQDDPLYVRNRGIRVAIQRKIKDTGEDYVDVKGLVWNWNTGGSESTHTDYTKDLPRYSPDGREYVYRVVEITGNSGTVVSELNDTSGTKYWISSEHYGYEISYNPQTTEDMGAGSTLEIENKLETVTLRVTKDWKHADGTSYSNENHLPVDLELKAKLADGTPITFPNPVTVTLRGTPDTQTTGNRESAPWVATFEGLPRYYWTVDGQTAQKQEIIYTVEEVKVITNPDGTKVITPDTAPDGFWKTEPAGAEPDSVDPSPDDSASLKATVTNTQTQLVIVKQDETGAPLAGAGLAIYEASDFDWNNDRPKEDGSDAVHEWMSAGNAETITEKLNVGTEYVLYEATAPAGYVPFHPVKFKMNRDGTVEILENTGNDGNVTKTDNGHCSTITAKDPQVTVSLLKTAVNGSESIENDAAGKAVFKISTVGDSSFVSENGTGTSTEDITDLTSATIGTKLKGRLIVGNTYTLTETTAPKGYELAEPYTFKIGRYGTIIPMTAGADGSLTEGTPQTDSRITIADQIIQIGLCKVSTEDSSQTKTPIAGAVFKVTPDAGSGFVTESKNSGITVISEALLSMDNGLKGELIAGNTYVIDEVTAPDGYEKAKMQVKFRIDAQGDITVTDTGNGIAEKITDGNTGYLGIQIKDTPIEITLLKKDFEDSSVNDKELLPGVTFTVKEVTIEGEGGDQVETVGSDAVATVTTDSSGKLSFGSAVLKQGHTYRLFENKKSGYQDSDTPAAVYQFTVDEYGNVINGIAMGDKTADASGTADHSEIVLLNKRTPGKITVTKENAQNEKLAGAEFTLYHAIEKTTDNGTVYEAGSVVTEVFDGTDKTDTRVTNSQNPLQTGADGTVSFENLPWGTYIVKETKAPDGYTIPADAERVFVVGPEEGNADLTHTYTFVDSHNGISFQKYAAGQTGPTAVSGAEFSLAPSENSSFAGLDDETSVAAFEAYYKAFDAHYESSAGKITWSSLDNKVFTLEGYLIAGNTYELTETAAPDGYELNTGIYRFRVEDDGTIEWADQAPDGESAEIGRSELKLYDTLIEINIEKQDIADASVKLKDAVFMLEEQEETQSGEEVTYRKVLENLETDGNGKITIKNTAGANGILLKQNTTYRLTETMPPYGYEAAEPVFFTVGEDGNVTISGSREDAMAQEDTITVKDKKITLDLTKQDFTDKKVIDSTAVGTQADITGLDPAEFTVSGDFVNNGTVASGTVSVTSSDMSTLTGKLIAGKTYTVTETSAPQGYEILADSFTFVLGNDGNICKINNTEITAGADGTVTGTIGNTDYAGVSSDDADCLIVRNTPITAELVKTDITDTAGTTVEGGGDGERGYAEFTIEVTGNGKFVSRGTTDGKTTCSLTADPITGITSQNIASVMSGRLIAENVYKLIETKAPLGYECTDPVYFTVSKKGVLQITDENGKTLDSSENAQIKEDDRLVIKDRKTSISIEKTDDKGTQSLAGAKFSLKPADESRFASVDVSGLDSKYQAQYNTETGEIIWISVKDSPLVLEGCLAADNTYVLKELTAPEGYILPDNLTVTFTIDRDGTVITEEQNRFSATVQTGDSTEDRTADYAAVSEDKIKLTVKDKPITISLVKRDYTSVQEVANDSYDSKIADLELGGVSFTVKELILDGDGNITEEKAVPGINDPVVTGSAEGKEGTLSFPETTLVQGRIYGLYEHLYPGYYEPAEETDTKLVYAFRVEENGTVTKVKESGSSSQVSGEGGAALSQNDQTDGPEIELFNKRIPGTVSVEKRASEDVRKLLEGAEFTLYRKNDDPDHVYGPEDMVTETFDGTSVTESNSGDGQFGNNPAVTGEDGRAVFSSLPWGNYILRETKAPEGYTIPENNSWEITIGKNGTDVKVISENVIWNEKNTVAI